MAKKYDIFISYRRKGGIKDARLIDEKLRNGGYSVFFDLETLGSGKFTDELRKRLENCKDFIVIFEPSYYQKFYDENGRVQPKEILEQDWCYLELKDALQMNKNIIPLVPENFTFPANLPKEIKEIAEINAIQLTEKEFKEIFEYKIKSYMLSKPKLTRRHKKFIITVSFFAMLAMFAAIAYFVSLKVTRISAEAERAVFVADSIKKAMEEAEKKTEVKEEKIEPPLSSFSVAASSASGTAKATKAIQKTELYWVSNGDETGKILFSKLSKAGLKSGKCGKPGFKVLASSKPSCSQNAMGFVKCAYTPQLTVSACDGSMPSKMLYKQTFSGLHKDEAVAKQKMQEELQKANFSSWISKLSTFPK